MQTIRADRERRRQRTRARIDLLTTRIVAAGGIGVMLLIGAIFAYLLWVVLPLFAAAELTPTAPLEAHPAAPAAPVLLDVEESGEIAYRIDASGTLVFLDAGTGAQLQRHELSVDAPIRRVHRPDPEATLYALETRSGQVSFVEFAFPVSFATGARRRLIRIETPFDGAVVDLEEITDAGTADLAVHLDQTTLTLAVLDGTGRLQLLRYEDVERDLALLPPALHTVALAEDDATPLRVLLASRQWLFVVGAAGRVAAFDVRYADDARRLAHAETRSSDPQGITLLLGGSSLLVPAETEDGASVEQWFPTRGTGTAFELRRIRSFAVATPAARILPEARRRGFLVLGADGSLSAHHTTAQRTQLRRQLAIAGVRAHALSARGDLLLLEDDDGRLHGWAIANEHPEASASALLRPVWYDGYDAPSLSWQSSSASTDFEPKFSLAPLALGTLKAAFYSMLFAIPVAILGAIYTAYFMAPALRAWIKPSIELMAALPTVILGFLAGLWLAPIIERSLSTVLTFLALTPVLCLGTGALLQRLPRSLREPLPEGWPALVMVPVLGLCLLLAASLGPMLDSLFAGGDLREWLRVAHGIDYDQRNAIVVGVAMGVAVIPVIFAIAEDSIHSVPTRLSHGALALGASRWQTLLRVVLPTASPGIFSALMIGFGRAIGETMIVLMASGNTPILGFDPFSGMRTLAANVAVELPESEVASTHYRILFLSALALFVFTFLVNTVGEVVRQRLRERYGHL